MKPIIQGLLLTALTLTAFTAQAASTVTGRVIHVSDGDTLIIEKDNGQQMTIRLWGVDTPETGKDGQEGQPYGPRAKDFVVNTVHEKVVRVRLTGDKSYDRFIGTVMLGDYTLGEALVAKGYAWWYEKYAPDYTKLERLQASAKDNRRGLWSQANPVPPWEFRH